MLLKVDTKSINGETALDLWKIGGQRIRVKRPFDLSPLVS